MAGFVKCDREKEYGGFRQVVKTTDCGSVMRGFESHNPPHLQIELQYGALF